MDSIRFHLTNITGAGAVTLVNSLLPSLLRKSNASAKNIDLPERGPLSTYESTSDEVIVVRYTRYLPNALSRILECTFFSYRFDGSSSMLVLGDLPLRCSCRQTLFIQTSHLVPPRNTLTWIKRFKYVISRVIFRLNSKFVDAFIVQTEVMRTALEEAYPSVKGRVHIIPQPVPKWLLASGLKRSGRISNADMGLNLIYPAAGYPHKNHHLLSKIDPDSNWPIEELQITLDAGSNPAPHLCWLSCRGFFSPQEMIGAYSQVDALLFLSKDESYGFPLIEAMYVGLPIICPDLRYAHVLCGDEAIYFDPDRVESLRAATRLLISRLKEGWWPNWDEQMKGIPKDWDAVAEQMLQITTRPNQAA